MKGKLAKDILICWSACASPYFAYGCRSSTHGIESAPERVRSLFNADQLRTERFTKTCSRRLAGSLREFQLAFRALSPRCGRRSVDRYCADVFACAMESDQRHSIDALVGVSFKMVWLGMLRIVILAIGYGGLFLLRHDNKPFGLFRILSLELAALLTLGLLAVIGSDSLVRAEAGLDGGRLGWSIAYLLDRYAGAVWAALIICILWLVDSSHWVWFVGCFRSVALEVGRRAYNASAANRSERSGC